MMRYCPLGNVDACVGSEFHVIGALTAKPDNRDNHSVKTSYNILETVFINKYRQLQNINER